MRKSEFVASMAKKAGISTSQAGDALNAFIEILAETLQSEGKIVLPKFGTFTVQKKKARTGRNPQTGAVIRIPAKLVVTFRSSIVLKLAVEEEQEPAFLGIRGTGGGGPGIMPILGVDDESD